MAPTNRVILFFFFFPVFLCLFVTLYKMVQSAVGEYSMSYCTIYELIAREGADELKVESGSDGSGEVGRHLVDTSVQ